MKKRLIILSVFAIALLFITGMIFTGCSKKTDSAAAAESSETIDENSALKALAKEAFDAIMPQGGGAIFFTEDRTAFHISDYSIQEDVLQRGYEGDPDIHEFPLYAVQQDGQEIMHIAGGEIIVTSDKVKTIRNIGVNSTIEEFARAYPDFGIFYTYVSWKYWLSTDQYPKIQFLLDKNDFLAEWDGSTIQELSASDFKPNSKISKIRIYEDDSLFLH